MPIVIKCTSAEEAKTALSLHDILCQLHYDIETDSEMFAKALAAASDWSIAAFMFNGPFYAVYRGKTTRAIYVQN